MNHSIHCRTIAIIFFLLLLCIALPTTDAFHSSTPRISTASNIPASKIWYKPASNKEENSGSESIESTVENDGNANLFLSQMASNINQKVQESHPITQKNMDDLDTKAKMKQWAGKYDQKAMKAKLQDRIANNAVFLLVYGTCPYCVKLLEALKAYSQANPALIQRKNMLIVDLDALGIEKYALRTEVMELVDHNTIPALWVGGQFIGGWQQVQDLSDHQDEFQILLENAMKVASSSSSQ